MMLGNVGAAMLFTLLAKLPYWQGRSDWDKAVSKSIC